MFRLDSEDSPALHLRAGRFHARACARYPVTQPVAKPMLALIADLKSKSAAWDAARDAEADAHADLSLADADADDTLRQLWSDAMAADQKDPSLGMAKAIFPEGLTPAVKPIGAAEGGAVDEVAKRLADPKWASHPLARQYAPQLAQRSADVTAAGAAYVKSAQAAGAAGVMAEMAKAAVREQLEAGGFGALHQLFKAQPARVDRFFLPRNGGRRRVAHDPAPQPQPAAHA